MEIQPQQGFKSTYSHIGTASKTLKSAESAVGDKQVRHKYFQILSKVTRVIHLSVGTL